MKVTDVCAQFHLFLQVFVVLGVLPDIFLLSVPQGLLTCSICSLLGTVITPIPFGLLGGHCLQEHCIVRVRPLVYVLLWHLVGWCG